MKSEESDPKPVGQTEASAKPPARPPRKRRWLGILLALIVAAVVLFVGIPRVLRALNSVSTDDAYVNGYVTFVAPRVSGQVARVLVDDNNRVTKEPYRVQLAIKQAAVDSAQADLRVAQATVRGTVAKVRSQRFKLSRAIEDVDNHIALVRARVATWEQSKATLVLSQ